MELRHLLDNLSLEEHPFLSRGRRSNSSVSIGDELDKEVIVASVGNRQYVQKVKMVKVKVAQNELDLPYGTKVIEDLCYSEINTPAVQALNNESLNAIVPRNIAKNEVSKDHQVAFYDTQAFNSIQSVTFDVAYKTDENMLICAPTGAGKTLIAVLCILRELCHYASIVELKASPFKIVYIAPMKALAAEVVKNLKLRLEPLRLVVREFTGDMHLYAEEIDDTDVLVTTPEKWDTVTRRNTGEDSLFHSVRLLIIDEVHLLNGDRGPVLEAIVARTFRVKEAKNSRLRIIGLSASLPNYMDIAEFLHVRPNFGLFYFNWGFRPVPLQQTFIGTKNSPLKKHLDIMNDVCYKNVVRFVRKNQQVLIFVHSRANTINTALFIEKCAEHDGEIDFFRPLKNRAYYQGSELLEPSKLKKLKSLYDSGLGFHHAGMLREDRQIVEQLFASRLIKVLVSTATLAWGVNFPAHAVIIKGTRMYSPSKGSQSDVDLLDVQQMFGRAGRPQFDLKGEAIIITNQIQLPLYLSLLTWQTPIKSNMIDSLADHLNAEIAAGTVNCVMDGVKWLKDTFLYICMVKRPLAYKVTHDVEARCKELVMNNAWTLHNANMIIYNIDTSTLQSTEIGCIASHTYILHSTIRIISSSIETCVDLPNTLLVLSKAKEYEQVKERPEEGRELLQLRSSYCRYFTTALSLTTSKVVVLLQTYMSYGEITNTALYLDQVFIVQNAKRILRAVFDIAVVKHFAHIARIALSFQKCLEHHCWPDDHPICQMKNLEQRFYSLLHQRGTTFLQLREMTMGQIKKLTEPDRQVAKSIYLWIKAVPLIAIEVSYYRLTPDFIRIELNVTPNFIWKKTVNHDVLEPFIAWVENPDTNFMYPPHRFTIHQRQAERNDTVRIQMNVMVQIDEIIPNHLLLHIESQYWLGVVHEHKLKMHLLMEPSAEPSFSAQIHERVDLSQYQELEENDPAEEDWDSLA